MWEVGAGLMRVEGAEESLGCLFSQWGPGGYFLSGMNYSSLMVFFISVTPDAKFSFSIFMKIEWTWNQN